MEPNGRLASHGQRAQAGAANERLVRHYVQLGVLTPPDREGREALFGLRQVVEFLAARYLLQDGWPLAKVAEIVRTADDLIDPFREECEFLNALCARRLHLSVEPAPGVKAKVLNDYVFTDKEGWELPDPAFGGEAWAVVRLRVPIRSRLRLDSKAKVVRWRAQGYRSGLSRPRARLR